MNTATAASRPPRRLGHALALVCRMGPLLALFWSSSAHSVIVVEDSALYDVETTITSKDPSPFPNATFTGSSSFDIGSFDSTGIFHPTTTPFGATTYSGEITTTFDGNGRFLTRRVTRPLPSAPPDALIWQLGGIVATVDGMTFIAQAFPPQPTFPSFPPSASPLITISADLFGSPSSTVTGGIFAFDAPVQIGTYTISVTSVPEPPALLLIAIALVALGTAGTIKASSARICR